MPESVVDKFVERWGTSVARRIRIRKELAALLGAARADGVSEGIAKAHEALKIGRRVQELMEKGELT